MLLHRYNKGLFKRLLLFLFIVSNFNTRSKFPYLFIQEYRYHTEVQDQWDTAILLLSSIRFPLKNVFSICHRPEGYHYNNPQSGFGTLLWSSHLTGPTMGFGAFHSVVGQTVAILQAHAGLGYPLPISRPLFCIIFETHPSKHDLFHGYWDTIEVTLDRLSRRCEYSKLFTIV